MGKGLRRRGLANSRPAFGETSMRIAQLAPLYEPVPPPRYGGTERIVAGLTEELVRNGHDVVLFASGDSATSAELVTCSPGACARIPASKTRWRITSRSSES